MEDSRQNIELSQQKSTLQSSALQERETSPFYKF